MPLRKMQIIGICTLVFLSPLTLLSAKTAKVDLSFSPDVSGSIVALATQSDGKLLIGGDFQSVNGVAQGRLSRLEADGSLDTNFTTGTGVDQTVNVLLEQPDNKILVAGRFSMFNGLSEQLITRLDSDGTKDQFFNQGSSNTAASEIFSMTRFSTGQVIIGGAISQFNGAAGFNGMIRLTVLGRVDRNMANTNGSVLAMALQTDNNIIIGGDFTLVNGVATSLARVSTAGLTDPSFSATPNGAVSEVTIQTDGKILVAGQFTQINGVARDGIARLNVDGSLDTGFDVSLVGRVYSIVELDDGEIVIGGDFTSVNGVARQRLAKLNADGMLDSSFEIPANGVVRSIVVEQRGDLVVGGDFTMMDGLARNRIARIRFIDDEICVPVRNSAGQVAVFCV